MNNHEFETASQKDREFEELLCLAYLYTHAGYVEASEDPETVPADNVDLHEHQFCN